MLKVYSNDLGDVGKVLHQLHHCLDKPQPLMRKLATLLANSSRKRFETKLAPSGEKWAPWQDSTKLRYAKKTYRRKNKKRYLSHLTPRNPERLMRDKGILLRSLTRHATENMALVGTNLEYARFHQLGTRKMVARPMFGISAQDRMDIVDELQKFVQQQWSEAKNEA